MYTFRKPSKANKIFSFLFHPILRPRAKSYKVCKELLCGKTGFEIGGPSHIFTRKGLLPIYPIVAHLDNCNFSQNTLWENVIKEGPNFQYDKRHNKGYQFIREATDLNGIQAESYDFILSSHTLEHTSNPLHALYEWIRILKKNGILVLLVPHKDCTFDHQRPVTTLEHLIMDFEQGIGEDDLSHLPEILELHDSKMDPPAGNFDDFKKRSEKNIENRCLHHHVFDTKLLIDVMNYIGIEILFVEPILPFHIIGIGKKVDHREKLNNEVFLDDQARFCYASPFPSDQV